MDILRSRLSSKMDEDVKKFVLSLEVDTWLFDADIQVDRAHVLMLCECGIISKEDAFNVFDGLKKIENEGIASINLSDYEDIHAAIETNLIKAIGEAGGRIHTARSRNDEVATCIRIALRDELLSMFCHINELRGVFIEKSKEHIDTVIPGFTHLQHAQPTTLAHHLLCYTDLFGRDFTRLMNAYAHTNLNPLGAAAFASTSFPIDRKRTTELLGFDGLIENSMDAVSSRDYLIECLCSFSNLMTNLSRLCEEIILWATSEFGFIELDDAYSSVSSIMPQKKNPDVAELIRGKTGTVYGCLTSALSICKSLPLSYNRDLQEVTPSLLRAVKITSSSIRIASKMIETMNVKKEAICDKLDMGFICATEIADTIVRSTGIPFRNAHQIVGSLAKRQKDVKNVRLGEIDNISMEIIGKKLSELGLTEEMLKGAVDVYLAVEAKDTLGGPASKEVKRMLTQRNKKLKHDNLVVQKRISLVKEAMLKLDGATI